MRTFFCFLLAFSLNASAQSPEGKIQEEFSRLYATAASAQAEYEIGGFLKGKSFGDHELLWRLKEDGGTYDVIRIFREKGQGSFEVTFYRADHIVPGRTVIRRFVGPGGSGWRNDTVDAETGEYLGFQGAKRPRLDDRDQAILEQWGISLF